LKVEAKQYLTEEQMNTVKSAKIQSIAYEDFSNGHKEHPHMGAVDENGTWGYVHDASALHKNPPAFQPPEDKSVACRKDDHYKMLSEKVKVDFEGHNAAERSEKRRAKIFCVAYTTEKNHDRINTLRETWG
jgi:glycoprotein-N-acetylgalactosamine 3-beta-galactosyltransferase